MTNLELITNLSTEEEIEEELDEINLPDFDIILYEESTWFSDVIEDLEKEIKKNGNIQSVQ